MDIIIDEFGSDAFYKEVVNVFYQYRKLVKVPSAKVKNMYNQYSLYMVADFVLAALLVYMGFDKGFDFLIIGTLVLIALTGIITGFNLYSMNVLMNRIKADHDVSILTINEEGVSLARKGMTIMGLSWERLSAVRFLPESVCFLAGDATGTIICVQSKYEDEIRKALEIYNVD